MCSGERKVMMKEAAMKSFFDRIANYSCCTEHTYSYVCVCVCVCARVCVCAEGFVEFC